MEQVLTKIKELIPQAPADWAQKIAKELDKSVDSVYSYANGTRGLRRGYPQKVLASLKKMIEEKQTETKMLIN